VASNAQASRETIQELERWAVILKGGKPDQDNFRPAL